MKCHAFFAFLCSPAVVIMYFQTSDGVDFKEYSCPVAVSHVSPYNLEKCRLIFFNFPQPAEKQMQRHRQFGFREYHVPSSIFSFLLQFYHFSLRNIITLVFGRLFLRALSKKATHLFSNPSQIQDVSVLSNVYNNFLYKEKRSAV